MIEKVRAKFVCGSITQHTGGMKIANLNAVCGTSEENKDFTQYTPNGSLQISIAAGAAAGEFFAPGKSYYLDFTAAP